MEVLMYTNFVAWDTNLQTVTLSKNYKFIIVAINENSDFGSIQTIQPERNIIFDDYKVVERFSGHQASYLKGYENCKKGDVIQAGSKNGTCANVTIIGIN